MGKETISDYQKREKDAKRRFPSEDPIHVMSLDKKGVDHAKIFAERDAFYKYVKATVGYVTYGLPAPSLPDGGPKYWCGGLGCVSDADLNYVEQQVAKGVSFIKLLEGMN